MIQLPAELRRFEQYSPTVAAMVGALFLLALGYVLWQHYLNHRHRQRMDAQRRWGEYQGGSVRQTLRPPETIYSIAGTTPPDITDCADEGGTAA